MIQLTDPPSLAQLKSGDPASTLSDRNLHDPDCKEMQTDDGLCDDSGCTKDSFMWEDSRPAASNYEMLGAALAKSGDLFAKSDNENGLLMVRQDGTTKNILSAADFGPVIVDRIRLIILLDGKPKGSRLSSTHLNDMLRTKAFLSQFAVVDQITTIPHYLPDFSLTEPGYNDGGDGQRYILLGDSPQIDPSMKLINSFLDVMSFDSTADRANTIAAAVTAVLRNHWPGAKPIILATATKSHAGKDTIIDFAAGPARKCSLSYTSTDWASERAFVNAVNYHPDLGVIVFENARLAHRDRAIASATIERFATEKELFLTSPGTGAARSCRNNFVLAISTNFGTVSEDILNRSLPIHLNPVGHVADRDSPIGDPRREFLPANEQGIAAELRGMIEKWKADGRPLDHEVKHPFSQWAKVIGGILKANGVDGFLENYGKRRVADDPIRESIGLLATQRNTGEWYRIDDWIGAAVKLGVVKKLIRSCDLESHEAKKRALGKVLSHHKEEIFEVETDSHKITVKLEKGKKRFEGEIPHSRYRFVLLGREELT